MPDWMIPIITSSASVGVMLTILGFFVNSLKKDFDEKFITREKVMMEKFDEKIATMVSQFNTLANSAKDIYIATEGKFNKIQESLNSLMSIEKESSLLREMFIRDSENTRSAIARIHDRIDTMQRSEK